MPLISPKIPGALTKPANYPLPLLLATFNVIFYIYNFTYLFPLTVFFTTMLIIHHLTELLDDEITDEIPQSNNIKTAPLPAQPKFISTPDEQIPLLVLPQYQYLTAPDSGEEEREEEISTSPSSTKAVWKMHIRSKPAKLLKSFVKVPRPRKAVDLEASFDGDTERITGARIWDTVESPSTSTSNEWFGTDASP